MLNGLALSYTIFTIILVVVDLYFAFRSFRKGGLEGEYLGKCSLLAALVAFSYLISIIVPNYTVMSITSSIYFIAIDWLLIMMIRFVSIYTTKAKEVITRPIMRIIQAYAVFETIVFAINPFKEIAISYVPRNTPIASYIYVMKPLYYMHLIFTYLMVIALLGILTRKILMTPRHYRLQYGLFIMAILFVVVINAFFILPIPMRHRSLIYLLDSSIPGYSLGLLIMYWSCFKYRDVYLKQGLSKMVFDNLEQGIALFDYDDFLVLSNDRLGDMIPSLKGIKDIKIDEFVDICGIGEHRSEAEESYSISFFTKDNKEGRQLRCDFMRLKDEDGMALGKLFVYTDAIEEIDILTGFHSWDHFRQFVRDYPEIFAFPYAVAEFDINGMGSINRNRGKEVGDDLLRSLASMIRSIMPEESYFVRGYDANLIAISYYITEEEMREYGDRITTEFTAKVQVGYSSSGTGSDDVLDRIADARRSMKIKKLLDDHSTHSQTITSLVRTLKESDSDTEAHVNTENRRNRNLFMYSLFRCAPLCLQEFIYDGGDYLSVGKDAYNIYDLIENYKVLENFESMTQISDDYPGSLFLIDNETTHDVATISNYDPYTPYEFEDGYTISDGENEIYIWDPLQAGTYECLVAALYQLGDYMDYLRANGVYDNTRIIIVSDHGYGVYLFEDLISEDFQAEWYNCLLMVKDFDSTGFTTDYTFMTNADVPTLALEGIVDNPVNPGTGNPINSDLKYDDIYVGFSLTHDEKLWNPEYNLGSSFYYDDDYKWFQLIDDDIFVQENWVETEYPLNND